MASFLYFSFLEDVLKGDIDVHDGTFRLMVVGSSYTPLQTHSKRSDVVAHEISLANYDAGGELVDLSVSRTDGVISIVVPSVFWPGPLAAGTLIRRGIVYHDLGGDPSADHLVMCLDPSSPPTTNGTSLTFSVGGPVTISVPVGV